MASPHIAREIGRSILVDHSVSHPNGSPPHRDWAQNQTLHVAAVYSNPFRWRTRRFLFNDFIRHMRCSPNIVLYVGELAYGDRPFEVTTKDNPLDMQWRTREVLWHKENLINQVVRRFDPGWEYGAYCDGDFHFTRHDVGLESIHLLQMYDWVQMFSTFTDLDRHHRPLRVRPSFGWQYTNGLITDDMLAGIETPEHYYSSKQFRRRGFGAPGGAWAFRRSAYDKCGGVLDTCILGSADYHMAFGLAGHADEVAPEMWGVHSSYTMSIRVWQDRAKREIRRNIGCVDGHAVHHWHGSKSLRGYGTRWKILRDNDFNPYVDIFPDAHGIYQLRPDRIELRDQIRKYFKSRDEDHTQLYDDDKHLIP